MEFYSPSIRFSFILIILCFHKLNAFFPTDITKRFEYKLSFKGPHMVFKDGTIPFWEHGGSAIASNEQIRITPSIKSQKGRIWSKNVMSNPDWEIEVVMRINGRGRVGADGMAIWFTEKPGVEGPVFGSNDHWHGLGIFLDSFDNDAQQNNPYISVMTNDGTKTFDHHRDGLTQQLGGCLRDFRNKPFPIRIKLEYYKKALTVMYHGGLSNDLSQYEICARMENVELPHNGHFGVTAATGGLADDHDVIAFITHSLVQQNTNNVPSNEEQIKYDKEYEQFLKQLEDEKEKFKKEHPEKNEEIDEKKIYEAENDRQFNTILQVQNQIHQSIRSLDSKISEISGRQESVVSLLTSSINNIQQTNTDLNAKPSSQKSDSLKREEINHILNQQNELIVAARTMHQLIADVHKKTMSIQDSNKNQQAKPSQANNIDPSILQQISDSVKNMKFEMVNLFNKNQPRCPEMQSCLSTFYFVSIIGAQSILFIIYFVYKNRSETLSKKFY